MISLGLAMVVLEVDQFGHSVTAIYVMTPSHSYEPEPKCIYKIDEIPEPCVPDVTFGEPL